MAGRTVLKEKSRAASFFSATLVLWSVSLWFEILFDRRFELLYVVFGALFYQSANSAIRFLVSKDPLLVNTSVSLLHSTITSASGSLPLFYPRVACFLFFFFLLILLLCEWSYIFLAHCLILCLGVTSSSCLKVLLIGIRNFICTLRKTESS